eukprot:8457400-Lingulodinium_polyedra.AAC.1
MEAAVQLPAARWHVRAVVCGSRGSPGVGVASCSRAARAHAARCVGAWTVARKRWTAREMKTDDGIGPNAR